MNHKREMEYYRFDENGEYLEKPIRVYYRNGECKTPENEARVNAGDLGMNFLKYTGMTKREPWKTIKRKKEQAQYFGSWDRAVVVKTKDDGDMDVSVEVVAGPVVAKKRGRPAKTEKNVMGQQVLTVEEKIALNKAHMEAKKKEEVA